MFASSTTYKLAGSNNSSLNNSRASNILRSSLEQQNSGDRRFRRMRCRICQRRFSTKKSYRYHMLHDHQIRNVHFIKCQMCDAEFAYEKGLKVHMFKVHNTLLKDEMIIKQYECEICSIVYSTDMELQQHLSTAHGKMSKGKASNSSGMEGQVNNDESNRRDMMASVNGPEVANIIDIIPPGTSLLKSTTSKDPQNQTASILKSASTSTVPQSAVPPPPPPAPPLYWYQCKYCPSNFNTNKKLAIHINSHDEFDSNDYSCKDCGNVYSGRKSLWVSSSSSVFHLMMFQWFGEIERANQTPI